MRKFFSVAPGVIWIVVILAITQGAAWLTEYYGGQSWVPPLVGFLTTVLVPVLKVAFSNELPSMSGTALRGERATQQQPRSAFSKWLI